MKKYAKPRVGGRGNDVLGKPWRGNGTSYAAVTSRQQLSGDAIIAAFLGKLEGVKKTGASQWVAKCPGHKDHSPSLSIGAGDDGRLLLHCFAGCAISEILGAVGLEPRDLFPERLAHDLKPKRRPFDAIQALKSTADEAQVAACAVSDLINHKSLSVSDYQRIQLAAERLHEAAEIADGH